MRGNANSRGVTWDKQTNRWKVRVRRVLIGFFVDFEEACKVAREVREKAGIVEYKTLETMDQKIEAVRNAGRNAK